MEYTDVQKRHFAENPFIVAEVNASGVTVSTERFPSLRKAMGRAEFLSGGKDEIRVLENSKASMSDPGTITHYRCPARQNWGK